MNGTPPVIELIIMAVEDMLWNLNAQDYSFQPVDVVRRLDPQDAMPADATILIEQSQQEEIVEYTEGGDACWVDKTQVVNIGVFCVPLEGEPADPLINERAADVIRVLMDRTYEGSGSPATRFYGHALASSRCLGVQPMLTADGGFAGFVVPLELHYRHKESDPTSNGV